MAGGGAQPFDDLVDEQLGCKPLGYFYPLGIDADVGRGLVLERQRVRSPELGSQALMVDEGTVPPVAVLMAELDGPDGLATPQNTGAATKGGGSEVDRLRERGHMV